MEPAAELAIPFRRRRIATMTTCGAISRGRRNPYFEVLRSYLRWRFIAIAIGVPALTAMQIASSARGVLDLVGLLLPFWILAKPLVSHLQAMFSSPRAHLTPGLYRAHFVVAGLFAGLFVALIPSGLAWAILGADGPHLSIVAEALATFAVACFCCQSPRGLSTLVFVAYVWLAVFRSYGRAVSFSLNMIPALLLLASSLLALMVVAVRLTSVREAAGRDRSPLELAGRVAARVIFKFWRRPPLDGSRYRRRFTPLDAASLPIARVWRRARHWDAAWGLTHQGIGSGLFIGGLILALRFLLRSVDVDLWALLLIFLPFAAYLPSVTFGELSSRTLLIHEFLRPHNRRQHVQAVGLITVGSVASMLVLAIGIPVMGDWVLWKAVFRPAIWWAMVAYGAWTPIFLGIGTANLDREESLTALISALILYAVYVFVVAAALSDSFYAVAAIAACTVSVVAFAVARSAYRSWLDRDLC
jgi:hypothetical protein